MAQGHIRKKQLATGNCHWEAFLYLGRGSYKSRTFKLKRDAQEWLNANSVKVREGTYARIKKATFAEYVEH